MEQAMKLIPETSLGKWAASVATVCAATLIAEIIFAAAIGGDVTVIDRSAGLKTLAGVLSILFTISGPLSLILGLMAFVKYKDWFVVKILAVLYAITLALFLTGEGLFPH